MRQSIVSRAAVAIAVLFAVGWAAQSPSTAQTSTLPPDLAELLMQNRAAVQGLAPGLAQPGELLRRPAASTGAAPPKIVAAKILTPTVNVQKAPAAPAIRFTYSAPAALFSIVGIIRSGSALQIHAPFLQEYLMGYGPALPIDKSGSIAVQSGPMNLYARPGPWTIAQLSIQDFAGRLVTYSGNELAKIIRNPTFQVVNAGTPDVMPPTVSAGKLRTPRVSLSSGTPFFGASFTVADDLSGVSEIFILLAGPKSNLSVLAAGFPPSPVLNGDIITGADMSSFKDGVGIWTMTVVQICDAATSCLFEATPTAIKQLLGTTTFMLTK